MCMLNLHVDESFNGKNGMYFVSGFLGNRDQWREYVSCWENARKPFKSLHVSECRLGSERGLKRYKIVLQRLGNVPSQCGLIPMAGSICRNDYGHKIRGTVLSVLMEGYVLAILTLLDEVKMHIPPDERLEILFEANTAHAEYRERAMILWSTMNSTSSGVPILMRWSSMPKGILTEAADYLCYALQQREWDDTSQKARLTSPILSNEPLWRHTGREEVSHWLDELRRTRTRTGDLREAKLI